MPSLAPVGNDSLSYVSGLELSRAARDSSNAVGPTAGSALLAVGFEGNL